MAESEPGEVGKGAFIARSFRRCGACGSDKVLVLYFLSEGIYQPAARWCQRCQDAITDADHRHRALEIRRCLSTCLANKAVTLELFEVLSREGIVSLAEARPGVEAVSVARPYGQRVSAPIRMDLRETGSRIAAAPLD